MNEVEMTNGERRLIDLGYKKSCWGKGYEMWKSKYRDYVEFHFDDVDMLQKVKIEAWNDSDGGVLFSMEDLEAIYKRAKELDKTLNE